MAIAPHSETLVSVDIETDHPESWLKSTKPFHITTQNISTLPVSPVFHGVRVNRDEEFELRFTVPEGLRYSIQADETLQHWTEVSNILNGTGEATTWVDKSFQAEARYYRIVILN